MLINNKNNQISLLIILYCIGILLVSFINPLLNKVITYASYITISIFYLLVIISVLKVFKNERRLINWDTKKQRIINIIIIISLIFFILIKIIFVIYAKNSITKTPKSYLWFISNLFCFFLSGPAEELLYKIGILSQVKKTKMPVFIGYIIIALLFSLAHWTFSYGFIVLFIIQLISLIIFDLFPSLILFSIIHSISNIIITISLYKPV